MLKLIFDIYILLSSSDVSPRVAFYRISKIVYASLLLTVVTHVADVNVTSVLKCDFSTHLYFCAEQ
jgi:hypothetical protein